MYLMVQPTKPTRAAFPPASEHSPFPAHLLLTVPLGLLQGDHALLHHTVLGQLGTPALALLEIQTTIAIYSIIQETHKAGKNNPYLGSVGESLHLLWLCELLRSSCRPWLVLSTVRFLWLRSPFVVVVGPSIKALLPAAEGSFLFSFLSAQICHVPFEFFLSLCVSFSMCFFACHMGGQRKSL